MIVLYHQSSLDKPHLWGMKLIDVLQSRIAIGLITLIIGLVVGYKNAPKPSHTIETKTVYKDRIVEVEKKVIVDRVITQKPDGTIITEEKDRSLISSVDKSKELSIHQIDKKIVDKNYLLFLSKEMIGEDKWKVEGAYKLYSNDRMDLFIKGDISLDGSRKGVGIGVGF